MKLLRGRIFYGWFVLLGCVLVTFGISGSNHSFGVFLKPMTEEFGWSRASLSLAFGITYMISGLLRPLAGYLADRYSPKAACLSGVMVMGLMLFLIPFIENLSQLYMLFAIMSIGVTLGSGPILTKVVSAWFQTRRGLMLSIVSGSGSLGAMILVPATSLFLVLFNWKEAYWFLALLLLFLILPIGILLIRNRPQEMGLQAFGADGGGTQGAIRSDKKVGTMLGRDATFLEALRSPLFAKLTLGYFVWGYSMSFVNAHFVTYVQDLGYGGMVAAGAFSIIGASAIVGALLFGHLSDSHGRRIFLSISYQMRCLGFVFVLLSMGIPFLNIPSLGIIALLIGILFVGFSWNSVVSITAAYASDSFGISRLGTIYGTMFAVMPLGSGFGAYLGGLLYDSRGTYDVGIWSNIVLLLLTIWAIYSIDERKQAGRQLTAI